MSGAEVMKRRPMDGDNDDERDALGSAPTDLKPGRPALGKSGGNKPTVFSVAATDKAPVSHQLQQLDALEMDDVWKAVKQLGDKHALTTKRWRIISLKNRSETGGGGEWSHCVCGERLRRIRD